jgi:6-phospho-beta-glucosidase
MTIAEGHSKLVVLGGSSPHTVALFPALQRAAVPLREVCLVGRSAERVERVGKQCADLARRFNMDVSVSWETDLARAASDSTYVLNVLRATGPGAGWQDRRALAMSGVVGHAASYLEAIRHLSPTLEAARTIQAVAPRATFINFANPVSILCEAVATRTELTVFGICHHAFSMQADFARLLRVAPARVHVEYYGINHVGWVTDVLIDGESQFEALVNALIAQRDKTYNYELVRALNAIPTKHAAALYYRGEVVYVRQNGLRVSLMDVAIRYSPGAFLRPRFVVPAPAAAPEPDWYASCIVPFLQTLDSGYPREHIVTWRTCGAVPEVHGATAETSAVIEGTRVRLGPVSRGLPESAQEWLRQVRTSECLLIRAVLERSRALLVEALAIHPNVASVAHAQRFVCRHALAGMDNV